MKEYVREYLRDSRLKSVSVNVAATFVALIISLLPLWIYITLHALMEPAGFWQTLALGAVGLYFLGSLQILGLVLFGLFMKLIWFD